MTPKNLFVALDIHDPEQINPILQKLSNHIQGIKIGLEFLYAIGWEKMKEVREKNPYQLFLDVKLHDISHTVARAIDGLIKNCQPDLITVHASGGSAMVKAAVESAHEAADKYRVRCPDLIAVTLLTSLEKSDLEDLGSFASSLDQSLRLANLAYQSGVQGVVCSGLEVGFLKAVFGPALRLVVPGVRPSLQQAVDQKRIITPRQAIIEGATDLVVGRPILQAANPAEAAQAIQFEIQQAQQELSQRKNAMM